MLRITAAQADALRRRPMIVRLRQELAVHEPRLAALPEAVLERFAEDGARRASEHGFTDFPSALFFLLTMVRVHPRFDSVGSIAAVLRRMQAEAVPARDRVARLIDEVEAKDWDRAAARSGYDAYFAALLRRAS